MPDRTLRLARRTVALLLLAATPLAAQRGAKPKSPKTAAAPTLVGTWTGTATAQLADSTIVVPVFYTFTQTAGTIGGTAMVPGQGTGTISNVTRDGTRLQFRVTATEGRLLEHDGKFGADGALEGLVNMDNLPVAKFRIVLKPSTRPAK